MVDNLLSYVKDTQGKPSVKERALFAAAVVFGYGIWENYVEQLAIEIVGRVSADIAPARVPDLVKKHLEKRTAWELSVSPGWRLLWVATVRRQAVGEDETFGMNTAKAGQVMNLLAMAGATDPFAGILDGIVPEHLGAGHTFVDAVNRLVELRGEIVHTGKVPSSLRKKHVLAWRSFVEKAIDGVDEACRAQCKALLS
ncbi:MAG: hypothetical protein AB1806_17285 [Acidobacteriota bacterium]